MLTGVRFDGAPKGDTVYVTVGLFNSELEEDVQVSYIADDRDTAANEANTKLTVAGENISLGDLLGMGMASKAAESADGAAGEFVESAVETLTDLRTEAELYAKYQAAAENLTDRQAFDERLTSIALRAQAAIDMIFGNIGPENKKQNVTTGAPNLPGEFDTAGTGYTEVATNYVRATQTLRGLNRLLDALSSADAFVEATKDKNNGVFENALGEDDARKAYSANKSEYTAYFGTTENTRYGAIALKKRVSKDPDATDATDDGDDAEAAAVYGTRFAFDGTDTAATGDEEDVGSVGAFSYANVNDTLRARNLPQTGGAVYSGGTVAATPAGTVYRGDMKIDVNFRQQSVFGRVSELKDKDNNLWKYLDSEVATIYLPKQNYDSNAQFGGTGANEDLKRRGDGELKRATIVYAGSPGFSTTAAEQPEDARFAGRFIGADGAEITGTWSLGNSARSNAERNDLDVIYGSYGVTRQDGDAPTGPADGTDGGAAKTTAVLPATDATDNVPLGATFAGDTDAAGILRLGKRSTGGGEDVNNDFDLKRIFAQPGATNPKKTVNNSPKHVDVVVEHIKAQRAIYVIYAEQVGGDSDDVTNLANVGRQNAWKSINDFVRDHIFDMAAVAPTGTGTGGAVLFANPSNVDNLSSPLGSYFYPLTRNNRPDDEAALERIDALLAAFDDVFAFEAALKDDGGGVFDSQPAQGAGATAAPFEWRDDRRTAAADTNNTVAAVFNRLSSQTNLWSLSTDYTRFGVWFRRETLSAVHSWDNHDSPDDGADTPTDTGSTSPGSYAYSWLAQSTYRTDRPVATYPSEGLATYEGRTLALAKRAIYMGDALIRVNWNPLDTSGATPVATSTIVPIFSNFRRTDNNTLDPLRHDHDADANTVAKIVDEIVFRTSANADLLLTDDEGKLMIDVGDAAATVTYTDGTRIGTAIAASAFMAKFVGSSGDGPLGVLGTWRVPGVAGAAGADNDLFGSFGADLTGFETLLP